jgi:16S rRNA (adenine1518-N6/adenine1519-N6)-dimethyltransferase
MSLKEQTIKELEQKKIDINPDYDQHFLVDEKVIDELIRLADIKKEDVVLEIGPGTGNITKILTDKAKKVIVVELDRQFRPFLQKLPFNVEVIFDDAQKFLSRNDLRFNKIVANIPYKICEPVMHYLNKFYSVEVAALIVPKSFVEVIKNPIFSAFLSIKEIKDVPKEAFYPAPKTNSIMISIVHNNSKEDNLFIRRKLYLQRDKKLINGLREAIIDLYKEKHNEQLTKKKAKEIVDSLKLDENKLNKKIENLPLEIYSEIAGKIEKLNI